MAVKLFLEYLKIGLEAKARIDTTSSLRYNAPKGAL